MSHSPRSRTESHLSNKLSEENKLSSSHYQIRPKQYAEGTSDEDMELLSKVYSNKAKMTMVDQNPHFNRSIIQSMIKATSQHDSRFNLPHSQLLPTKSMNMTMASQQASNDQDRIPMYNSLQPNEGPGIQTMVMSHEQIHEEMKLSEIKHQQMPKVVQFNEDVEMRTLQLAIEENNLQQFMIFGLSVNEILALRFKHSLNVLQAVSYFGSERILQYLKLIFKDEIQGKKDLISYQEPHGGNMAIHFAVLKGNKRIIECLLNDFQSDPTALTANGLCVIHCAAQFERGVLSMQYFSQGEYEFNIDYRDKFQCTPLHFAVLNMQVKCVECLLALKADPNSKNSDNQTPLHIAVQRFIQQTIDSLEEQKEGESNEFEDVKRVIKELLFNGADRSIEGKFNLSLLDESMPSEFVELTPFQLLSQFENRLPRKEFVSLQRILVIVLLQWMQMLSRQWMCFQTRRPLEKLNRDNRFMIAILLFNLVNFGIFLFYYMQFYESTEETTTEDVFYGVGFLGVLFFMIATVFYLMSNCMDPGYVREELDIIELLQIGNDRNIDLENFCFYCKVIKSTKTFHCMICGKCVEKFDHHCVYINNCLGHRNHKYFILFLIFIFLYFLTSTTTSLASFITHKFTKNVVINDAVDWIMGIYTVTINLLQAIPLVYQLLEQSKKLCKKEKIERRQTMTNTTREPRSRKSSITGQHNDMKESMMKSTGMVSRGDYERGGFCYNMKQMFCFTAATQEQLRIFLFSDSERFSTFIAKEDLKRKQADTMKKQITPNFKQVTDGESQASKTQSSKNRTKSIQNDTLKESDCEEQPTNL